MMQISELKEDSKTARGRDVFRETQESGIDKEIGSDAKRVHVQISCRFREHGVFYGFLGFLLW